MSKMRLSKQYILALAAITAISGGAIHAASGTWSGAGADANWSTTANWSAVPGSAIAGTVNNTDTATFSSNPANGTSTPIAIDTYRNIGNMSFTTTAGSFVIGSTAGNSLFLTNGGTTQILAALTSTGVTETIDAPLVLEPASGTTAGAYTFANNAADPTSTLVFGGAISAGTTTGTGTAGVVTLNINGTNAGANTISGNITDGGAVGGLAITKSGTGSWTLSGAISSTGTITANGGTLNLAGTITGASPITISGAGFAATTLNITGTDTGAGAVSLTGAAVNITGSVGNNSLGAGAISLTSSTFAATGASAGTYILGTGSFAMNSSISLTGSAGNTVNFTSASGAAASALTVGVYLNNSDAISFNGNGGTVSYTLGSATPTNALVRGTFATLSLAPSALGNLGASEKFIVNGLASTPGTIFSPWVVAQDTAAANFAADFVTYTGGTTGFQAASVAGIEVNQSGGTDINAAAGAVFNVDHANTALTSSIQLAALRTSFDVDPAGKTLTIGSAATTAGLILNGNGITIGGASNPGALSFGSTGTAEALIYTAQNATINSAITAKGGLTLFGPGNTTLNGNIALGTTGSTFATTGDVIINGNISGSGSFIYKGIGNLTLNGNNTFSGTFTVGSNITAVAQSSGTLFIGSNTAFGAATVDLYNGTNTAVFATLATTTDVTLANSFQIGINSGGVVSNIAVIAGTGNLTITGNFTDQQDYSTNVVNNLAVGKTLAFNGNFVSGSQSFLTISGSGNTVIKNMVTGNANVAYAGSGNLTLNGGWSNAGGLTVGTGSANGTVTLGVGSAGIINVASGTSTTGPLTSLEASTPLTGANALTGRLTIGGKTVASFLGSNDITFAGPVTASNVTGITIFNNLTSIATLTFSGNALTHAAGSTTNTGLTFAGTGNTVVSDAIGLVGTDNFSVVVAGSGEVSLSGANTFTGATTITGGTLGVLSLNSVSGGSGSSSLGAPTTLANGTISIGSTTSTGTLLDTGTGEITDRVINLAGTTGGATIDQSGTGLLKFTSALTASGKGAKTLTLQGSTAGTGEIAGIIVNSSSGATSVLKAGTGIWTLSGANTYTGGITITGGTLVAGAGQALGLGNVTVNGGTLEIDPPVNIGAGNFDLASGTLKLDLGTDSTNALAGTGTSTYALGAGTTVDLGIGAASFNYGNPTGYNILTFKTGSVASGISITDYDTADWLAAIADNGSGTAVLSFTPAAVPEPASLALLGLAGLPLLLRRRRRGLGKD